MKLLGDAGNVVVWGHSMVLSPQPLFRAVFVRIFEESSSSTEKHLAGITQPHPTFSFPCMTTKTFDLCGIHRNVANDTALIRKPCCKVASFDAN